MPSNNQNPAQIVEQFIVDNFVANSVTVTDFPLFPYGKLIKDRFGGEMVVYYDFFADDVKWVFPNRR